jgi:type IV fimbrial biogenesis protein FimT
MLRSAQRRASAGFTTVELMVTLAIVALLMALATPTLRGVVANGRVKSGSQSLQNGLALARAEAVRLNTQVEFVLAADGGWQIRRVNSAEVLQQAAGREGASGLVLTVVDAAAASADRITFNAFGQTASVNPSDGSNPIWQIDLTVSSPPDTGNFRPLRIEVFGAGMSRMCDPAVADTEYKACRN